MIRYKNYLLEPENGRFNLQKEVTVKAKDKPEHLRTVTMGYSMRFETCLHDIITDMLEEKQDITEISGYISEYKKAKQELMAVLY